MLADLIPHKYRGPGLSAAELAAAQEQAEAAFPADLRSLLRLFLPTGEGFPDWRHRPRQAMADWRKRLVDCTHFDVIENEFWLGEWGAIPDGPDESRAIVEQALADAPALVPIYLHRAIPNEPLEAGNPVFSFWHAVDTIVYGTDLADYLLHEFHPLRSRIPRPWKRRDARQIRFWSHLVDLGNLTTYRLPDGRTLAVEPAKTEEPLRCWIVEDPERVIVADSPLTAIDDLMGIPRGGEPDWVHSMAEQMSFDRDIYPWRHVGSMPPFLAGE